ncbi:MAG: dihydroorotate dehydrogenase electron transfer subunit [Thermotogae bacterium]|jgi:dihydroorotate dehydrogenase electron transfer subunit|nr:dihydroorotate dehydrogenase electron transfer subunit [Thermotogota bacterium]MDD8053460.1 dihydroorotate dehydrogenase electron transfer subunit [Thermotogota bacterium]HNR64259.1 dihydroorotate dehydrogenase electron transfer subunit [Thermotogota bacterium]HOZ12815.1 dihydroorotate dehydrogenase electron transfer subunit [Thermotogota bacterium]HPB87642.1 dihydroorotate dehydrogenase electron transfer subunit [Thermotogota bacterium]
MSPIIEKTVVLENIKASADSHILVLSSEKIGRLTQPGQFVEVSCDPDHLVLKRPFSVYEANEETLSLYVKRVGKGSQWLQQLRPGGSLEIIGPLGNGYRIIESGRCLLIGGGCGIASLKMLSREIEERGGSSDAIFGFKTAAEIPQTAIEAFQTHTGTMTVTVEMGLYPKTGTVVDRLKELTIGAYQHFYACGPIGMLKALVPFLQTLDTQVSLEMRMACGFGVCYGCSVKTVSGNKRVCCEGPVFSMQEVDWHDL